MPRLSGPGTAVGGPPGLRVREVAAPRRLGPYRSGSIAERPMPCLPNPVLIPRSP